MIIRCWAAQTTQANAPVYAEHLRTRVLPALHKLEGYVGARLLERATGGDVEILVITIWKSLAAIRAFAGADLEKAVVSDEIAPLLLRYDQRVRHYDLVIKDDAERL